MSWPRASASASGCRQNLSTSRGNKQLAPVTSVGFVVIRIDMIDVTVAVVVIVVVVVVVVVFFDCRVAVRGVATAFGVELQCNCRNYCCCCCCDSDHDCDRFCRFCSSSCSST